MPESFDHATTNPGSGGTNLAGDAFSQGGVPHFLPACYLVFGPADGPYTRADTGAGLPVSIQDPSLAVTQSGPWAVSVSGSVAVTGTFWPATQPVSGPLTDSELRASAVAVDTELPAAATLADATANPTAPAVAAFALLYNDDSGTWDREPAPTQGTLLASATRTATTSSATQTNRGHRGVLILLSVTAVPGSGSITVHIQGQDPVSSGWVTLNDGAPPVTTLTGVIGYELRPAASGGVNPALAGRVAQRVAGGLPRTWRVTVVHSSGTSFTYSVAYQLLR
jgi:hypothetical protein